MITIIIGKQPIFGLVGWVIEWLGAIIIYLICTVLLSMDWYATACILLLASFFGVWFSDFENWPFNKLGRVGEGILTVIASFFLGWLLWWLLDIFGLTFPFAFALIVNLYFLFLVTALAFGNLHLKDMSNPLKALINGIIYFGGAFLLIVIVEFTSLKGKIPLGIPPHWLPIALFYFLSLGAWTTREMKQPSKGIMNLSLVIFVTILYIIFLGLFGIEIEVLQFNPVLIAWVAILTATGIPLFVFLGNFPWRRLKQPLMGIVGLILLFGFSTIIMTIFIIAGVEILHIIGMGFSAVTVQLFMAFQFHYGIPECFEYLAGGKKE